MTVAWTDLERLDKERDLIGHYLSAHPLDEYSEVLERVCKPCEYLNDVSLLDEGKISVGGIVIEVKESITKNGDPCGFVTLEDFKGKGELKMFKTDWLHYRNFFVKGSALFITGNVQKHKFIPNRKEFVIEEVMLLNEAKNNVLQKLTIHVDLSSLDVATGKDLSETLKKHVGETPVHLLVTDLEAGHRVELKSATVKVNVCRELMRQLYQCGVKVTVND